MAQPKLIEIRYAIDYSLALAEFSLISKNKILSLILKT